MLKKTVSEAEVSDVAVDHMLDKNGVVVVKEVLGESGFLLCLDSITKQNFLL